MGSAMRVLKTAATAFLVVGFVTLAWIVPRRLADWTPCDRTAGPWCAGAGFPSQTQDSDGWRCPSPRVCADWSLPFLGVPSLDPRNGAGRGILLVYLLFGTPLITAIVVLVWLGKVPSLRATMRAALTTALALGSVVLGKMSSSYMASWVVCKPPWRWCTWLALPCHSPEGGAAADIFGQLAVFVVPVLAGIVALVWWGERLERWQVIRGAAAIAAALGLLAVGMYGSAYAGSASADPLPFWLRLGPRVVAPNPDLTLGLFLGYILYAVMVVPFLIYALRFGDRRGNAN